MQFSSCKATYKCGNYEWDKGGNQVVWYNEKKTQDFFTQDIAVSCEYVD